jgi:hypothetical protein
MRRRVVRFKVFMWRPGSFAVRGAIDGRFGGPTAVFDIAKDVADPVRIAVRAALETTA